MFYIYTGKGDLVGCDMNTYLQAYNGTGPNQSNNPDVVVKSSSDVKASSSYDYSRDRVSMFILLRCVYSNGIFLSRRH